MRIGLVGFASCGKGTVADFLVEKYGFTKLSFADSLKDAVSAIFCWPRHLLEGDTKESREFRETVDEWWTKKFGWTVTPRIILQKVGTDALRNVINPDIWIFSIEKRMEGIENVVIADVRFPNEMKFIRDVGGFNIRVKRGPEPEWFDAAFKQNIMNVNEMEKYNVHFSEWAWIGQKFDYVLDNDSSIDALDANTQHMLSVFSGTVNFV